MSELTSAKGKEMLSFLPPTIYENSKVVKAVLQAIGIELDMLQEAINEIRSNLFPSTATWALEWWENRLGLPTFQQQPVDERRDNIVSRIRGFGTATTYIVKKVAESYDKGSINIIEDHAAYTITVQFVDTTGVPPNLDDLKAAVRAVVPAHLDILYEFNYFLWQDLDMKMWTWDALDSLTLTWDELEVYD